MHEPLNLRLGKSGEKQAYDFLRDNGYKVLFKNYRTTFGEIDIIARDKDTLCFIEVKTRSSDRFGLPKEAVGERKQQQISKAALFFLKENNMLERKSRFDVVSVILSENKRTVELLKDAFSLDERFSI